MESLFRGFSLSSRRGERKKKKRGLTGFFFFFLKTFTPASTLKKKKQEQARGDLGQCRKGPRGRGRLPQGPGREAQLRPRLDQHGVRKTFPPFFSPSNRRKNDPEKKRGQQQKTSLSKKKNRIASANLGDYLASSRYYARALALNPRASSVWGYLRTSLACAGRADLLEAADAEDAAAIERALPL